MPTVSRSVIVARSCEAMFALVEDCERYPQFLPWCTFAEVLEHDAEITRARLDIAYRGLKTHISTLNRSNPPSAMTLEFVDGPFRCNGKEGSVHSGHQGYNVTYDFKLSVPLDARRPSPGHPDLCRFLAV